jgi:hypothetical protein
LFVKEVEFGQAYKDQFALVHLELHLDDTTNHLLRLDAMDLLEPRAHEQSIPPLETMKALKPFARRTGQNTFPEGKRGLSPFTRRLHELDWPLSI